MKNTIAMFGLVLVFGMNSLSMNNQSECIIFIGNPGMGKSTIVNSFVGKKVFESGLSATGVTKICQSYEHNGRIYVDTPGLADTALKNQAAREIEKALKKNKNYRIFFVLTLEAGRIKPDDLHTINRVMEAINEPQKSFNVIINKLTGAEKRALIDDRQGYQTLCQQINNGANKTDKISYITRDCALEDEDSEFIALDDGIRRFVEEGKSFYLPDYQVGKINTETAEELTKRVQKEEAQMRQQLEEQIQQRKELERQKAEMALQQLMLQVQANQGYCTIL